MLERDWALAAPVASVGEPPTGRVRVRVHLGGAEGPAGGRSHKRKPQGNQKTELKCIPNLAGGNHNFLNSEFNGNNHKGKACQIKQDKTMEL